MQRIGASEADVLRLEAEIAANPQAGDVIVDLKGLRKLRFRIGNRGKSSGGRVIYYVLVGRDTAILIFAHAKAEQGGSDPGRAQGGAGLPGGAR